MPILAIRLTFLLLILSYCYNKFYYAGLKLFIDPIDPISNKNYHVWITDAPLIIISKFTAHKS